MIVFSKKRTRSPKAAIFLDRDGTIVHDRPGYYLTEEKSLKLYKCAPSALSLFQEMGYMLIILTNQSGIARKYMTLEKSKKINLHLHKKLKTMGINIEGIYFCPHAPQDKCSCRKPKIGLTEEALSKHNINLSGSFMIGDKISDIKLGQNLKIKTILLKTGHGRTQILKYGKKIKASFVAKDILSAAKWIEKQKG
jgi:D-glycero-D-manno-heptose 1,7-bisphosphate phosphatase